MEKLKRINETICLFLCVMNVWTVGTSTELGALLDYCESDIFHASCQPWEVVVIKEALYGRMKLGTCLQLDVGYMDCYSDVLDILDRKCSGRRSCQIGVYALVPKTKPCQSELRSYLSARYICVPVKKPSDICCDIQRRVVDADNSFKYIASSVTEDTGCGYSNCPWRLTVAKGQRLNITLYDFEHTSTGAADINSRNHSEKHSTVLSCEIYAVLKEESPSVSKTLCASAERVTHVYTSTSNSIEIHLTSPNGRNGEIPKFLIEYEVFGCPDPDPPVNGFIKRNGDSAIVGCYDSGEDSWEIACQDGYWHGLYGNCSDAISADVRLGEVRIRLKTTHFPPGLVIALIIIAALVISTTIIVVGIAFLKRTNNNRHISYQTSLGPVHDQFSNEAKYQRPKTRSINFHEDIDRQHSEIPWQYTRPLPDPSRGRNSTINTHCIPANLPSDSPGNSQRNTGVKYYVLEHNIISS